jgi:hypothetical protein
MMADVDIITVQNLIRATEPDQSPNEIAEIVGQKLRRFGNPLHADDVSDAISSILQDTRASIEELHRKLAKRGVQLYSGNYFAHLCELYSREVHEVVEILKRARISNQQKIEIIDSRIRGGRDAIERVLASRGLAGSLASNVLQRFELSVATLAQSPSTWMNMAPSTRVTPLNIDEKRALRLRIVECLYVESGGNPDERVPLATMEAKIGVPEAEILNEIHYLVHEGLVATPLAAPFVAITFRGVKEYEESQKDPTRPTDHFVPSNRVPTIINNFVNSQVGVLSQGAGNVSFVGSVQQSLQTPFFEKESDIREALTEFVDGVSNSPNLDNTSKQRILEQLGYLLAQANLPEEKRSKWNIGTIFTALANSVQTAAALSSLWQDHGDKIAQLVKLIG